MKVVLTGADGFLGWHTRCRLHALTDHEVVPITREAMAALPSAAHGADAIIHLAGINRAADEELTDGNARLARAVIEATQQCSVPPKIVYSNSIQAGNKTPYGTGKEEAGRLLAAACTERDAVYVDVRLPNLFGEHGIPNYNSFVPTFADKVLKGEKPQIQDRAIDLLHVQDAAQALIASLDEAESRVVAPAGHSTSVKDVWDLLVDFHGTYASAGEFPAFPTTFHVDLFNTYRAAAFPQNSPIRLDPRSDDRGRLVETVRTHGSEGQAFVSTTRPGITRGDHYHLSKIERFAVLSGKARIGLRRMFTSEVIEFQVDGDHPVAIDMPTMWTHNITNIGDTDVVTQFWTNELFDPQRPDTFWVKVDSEECSQ